MMVLFGTTLAVLLALADKGGSIASHSTIAVPNYDRYNYEAACEAFVFRAQYRNDHNGKSRVHHVLIDGRSVPGAVETFSRFATGRPIDYIEIMNCGTNPENPVFRGTIQLIKPESQPYSRQTGRYFRMIRHSQGWRMVVD